jgi:hypothetical protein
MLLITRHLAAMRRLACDTTTYKSIRLYFNVPRRVPLLDHLVTWNYGQADVVLALLRIDTPASLRHAEAFMGHAIVRCPPCLLLRTRTPLPNVPRSPRIVAVVPVNPRMEPLARLRFAEFRVGRTEEQLMARGISRRELSWAKKNRWIEVADHAV